MLQYQSKDLQRIYKQTNEEDTNINISHMTYSSWDRVEVALASRAVRSVMPKHAASIYAGEETSLLRTNTNLLAINNTVLENHEQRRVTATDDKRKHTNIDFQVADVSKTLTSVG